MENLSHLIDQEDGLVGGESMSASNTITIRPPYTMSAPGSESVNHVDPRVREDHPGIEMPPVKGPTTLLGTHGRKKA